MIIREWRGRANHLRGNAYPRHFRTVVLPELRRLKGFRGATLARRKVDDRIEFIVLTRWDSLESIRSFARTDIDRAVVEPGAVAALVEFDARVNHYEIVEEVVAQDVRESSLL
jgi:heme-degrading monooxygenase HmoA